jgi:glutathione peroxidase
MPEAVPRRGRDRDQRWRVPLTLAMIVTSLILAVMIVWTVVERAAAMAPRRGSPLAVPVQSNVHLPHFLARSPLLAQAADRIRQESKKRPFVAQQEGGGAGDGEPRPILDGVSAELLSGGVIDLATSYPNYVVLVVNVASHCGFTETNYAELQAMYDAYRRDNFVVLAFPCNQFGAQEADSPGEIMRFIRREKHATFPVFAKVDVNGEGAHPLYQRLKHTLNVSAVEWNFGKFLIGRDGFAVRYYHHDAPLPQLRRDIEALVSKR